MKMIAIKRNVLKISDISEVFEYLPNYAKSIKNIIEENVDENYMKGIFIGKLASIHFHYDVAFANYIGIFIKEPEFENENTLLYNGMTVFKFSKDEFKKYYNVLYHFGNEYEITDEYISKEDINMKMNEIKNYLINNNSEIFIFYNGNEVKLDDTLIKHKVI